MIFVSSIFILRVKIALKKQIEIGLFHSHMSIFYQPFLSSYVDTARAQALLLEVRGVTIDRFYFPR